MCEHLSRWKSMSSCNKPMNCWWLKGFFFSMNHFWSFPNRSWHIGEFIIPPLSLSLSRYLNKQFPMKFLVQLSCPLEKRKKSAIIVAIIVWFKHNFYLQCFKAANESSPKISKQIDSVQDQAMLGWNLSNNFDFMKRVALPKVDEICDPHPKGVLKWLYNNHFPAHAAM